jgi:hypothetical protein
MSIINTTFLCNRTESSAHRREHLEPTSESDNTSYAGEEDGQDQHVLLHINSDWNEIPRVIPTNFSSAFGSLFLSGWYFLLSRLYAFLMSASDAERCTAYRIDISMSDYFIYDTHVGSVAYSQGFCSSLQQRKRRWCRRRRK